MNGVRGEVRAETVSGDVDVVETPNLAIAKAVSGDVRARDIGTPTSLTLSTVSGSVIASALKVRTLEAGSVSGNVELTNLEVERLLAKTINGDITADGVVSRGGRYRFNAHSGDVRIDSPIRRVSSWTRARSAEASGPTFPSRFAPPPRTSAGAATRIPAAPCGPSATPARSVGAKLFGHGRHHEEVAEALSHH